MIMEPEKYVNDFKAAGADQVTVHIEACNHLHRNLEQIKSLGLKAGIAINPHTPVQLLADVLYLADTVCIMSVNPGFGGQKFIPHTIQRIQQLKQLITDSGVNTLIEIDGGVTLENAPEIVAAGADVLVAGNTVFKATDPKAVITALKNI